MRIIPVIPDGANLEMTKEAPYDYPETMHKRNALNVNGVSRRRIIELGTVVHF